MINVWINEHDMYDEFGLIMTYREIGVAQPNIYKQTVPGKNGDLDYTSFFGDITYKNREIIVNFSKKEDANTQSLKYKLEMMFSGKNVKLSFADDKDHYYIGRLTFNSNDDDKCVYDLKVCMDAYPFKYKSSDDSEVRFDV